MPMDYCVAVLCASMASIIDFVCVCVCVCARAERGVACNLRPMYFVYMPWFQFLPAVHKHRLVHSFRPF
jgi:hypothetical protein